MIIIYSSSKSKEAYICEQREEKKFVKEVFGKHVPKEFERNQAKKFIQIAEDGNAQFTFWNVY